jgi:hypothetical protein
MVRLAVLLDDPPAAQLMLEGIAAAPVLQSRFVI